MLGYVLYVLYITWSMVLLEICGIVLELGCHFRCGAGDVRTNTIKDPKTTAYIHYIGHSPLTSCMWPFIDLPILSAPGSAAVAAYGTGDNAFGYIAFGYSFGTTNPLLLQE